MRFICGSFFSQGDHFGQARKSFTSANGRSGGAAMTAERVTLNVDGRVAMRMTSSTMTTTSPMRILITMTRPPKP